MNKISVVIAIILFVCINLCTTPVCGQTKVTLDKKPHVESVKPTDEVAGSTKYTEAEKLHYQNYVAEGYKALLEDSLVKAQDCFAQAVKLLPNHPSNAEVYFQMGQIAEEREQFLQASDYYKKSTHQNENMAKSYKRRGAVSIILKDYETALREYAKYLQLKPKDHEVRVFRGYCYQEMGRDGEALAEYQAVISQDPLNVNAIMALASLDHKRGNTDSAIRAMDDLVCRFPDDATYYEMRGAFEMDVKRYQLAAYDFNKAVELDPKNPSHYLKRAAMHFKTGDEALAEADLKKAEELGAPKAQVEGVIFKANSDKRLRK